MNDTSRHWIGSFFTQGGKAAHFNGWSVGPACFRNFAREQSKGACEVHHVALVVSMVPLGYGKPSVLSEAYRAAQASDFPHAVLSENAGCMVNPFFKWARVRACSKCNAAEQEWLKTHRKYRYEEEQAQHAGNKGSGVHAEGQRP